MFEVHFQYLNIRNVDDVDRTILHPPERFVPILRLGRSRRVQYQAGVY